MLPSGAHVKIGDDEFILAESEAGHYRYNLSTLSHAATEIPGAPGTDRMDPELLFWTFDDWSGGEGNQFYDPSRPNRYDHGGLCCRMQGFVTNRPASVNQDLSTSPTPALRVRLAVGAGLVWLSAGQKLWKSSTGVVSSWSTQSVSAITGLGANWTIRAIAGDHQYIYVCAGDTPGGSTGKVRIIRINAAGTQTVFYSSDSAHDTMALAMTTGRLYRWTGLKLREYDVTSTSLPLTDASNGGSEVHYVGYEASAGSPDYPTYGDMTVGDNAPIYMASSDGTAQVWEYRDSVPRLIWTLPGGFTCRAIAFTDGVIYAGGSLDRRNTLYAFSTVTRQEVMISQIRPWVDREIQFITPGPASSVMFGGSGGNTYQYDSQLDAVTNIDVTATWQQSSQIDAVMYRENRIFAWIDDSVNTTIHTKNYGPDQIPDSTLDTAPLYMPAWDFGLPEHRKLLSGVEVLYKPLTGGQEFDLSYVNEEDGMYPGWNDTTPANWTVIDTVTGPTGGDNLVRKFLPISTSGDSISAFITRLRLRMTGAVRVYRITLIAYVAEYIESWDLLLRVAQEDTDAGRRRTRPRGEQRPPEQIRQSLRQAVKDKAVVTFVDGYPFGPRYQGEATTYSRCVLESPTDEIRNAVAEGVFALRIRNLHRP